jgi:hypothetical protein
MELRTPMLALSLCGASRGSSSRTAAIFVLFATLSCGGRSSLDVEVGVLQPPQDQPVLEETSEGGGATSGGSSSDSSAVEVIPGEPDSSMVDAGGPDVATAMVDAQQGSSDAYAVTDAEAGTDVFFCGGVQAVPVCVEYYALLSSCFREDETAMACQASLLPTSDADLVTIEQLCADSLQRLMASCR